MKINDEKIVLSEGAKILLKKLVEQAEEFDNSCSFFSDPVSKEERGWLTELKKKGVLDAWVDREIGVPPCLGVEVSRDGIALVRELFDIELVG